MFLNAKYIDLIKTKSIYKKCFIGSGIDQYQSNYIDAEQFFLSFWKIFELYARSTKLNNQVPGDAFEIIFTFILEYEGVEILSKDELVEGVDFVKPDFVVKKNYNFVSLKTSLRERWKQADWESIKYKQVYGDSKCYLLTNHQAEYKSLKQKISKLDIDGVFFSGSSDINLLIDKLK